MNKVLEFHADWCGPCKQLAPVMAEIEAEFGSLVDFQHVDIDSEVDLAYEYGIYSIPTLVFIKDGDEIGRISGYRDKSDLEDKMKSIYG